MEEGNKPNEDLSGLSVRMWLESRFYIKKITKLVKYNASST